MSFALVKKPFLPWIRGFTYSSEVFNCFYDVFTYSSEVFNCFHDVFTYSREVFNCFHDVFTCTNDSRYGLRQRYMNYKGDFQCVEAIADMKRQAGLPEDA